MNEKLLYSVIFETLKNEDKELTCLTNSGIFYSPELYIAFILGKNIKRSDKDIFSESVEWIRETNFGNGGPTDFAFKTNNKTYVFELKLRDTYHSYFSDIEKLKKLDERFKKYFLALVDSWQNQKVNDERIQKVSNEYPSLTKISEFESFSTKQDRYQNNICCTVALWKINEK